VSRPTHHFSPFVFTAYGSPRIKVRPKTTFRALQNAKGGSVVRVASFVSPHGKLRRFEKKGKQKKTRRLKKRKQKKHAEPKTRIGSVSCPVASAPDPNVRLKFKKPALASLGAPSTKQEREAGVSCPVASSPDPNVRLKFEKTSIRSVGIRHSVCSHNANASNITLIYWRSERIGGTIAAFAWRAEALLHHSPFAQRAPSAIQRTRRRRLKRPNLTRTLQNGA